MARGACSRVEREACPDSGKSSTTREWKQQHDQRMERAACSERKEKHVQSGKRNMLKE